MLTMGWTNGHSFIPVDFALLSSVKSRINGMMEGSTRTTGYKRRRTIDWAVALQQLLDLINEIATKAGKKVFALIQRQLQQWIAGLPSYIKAYLPISSLKVELVRSHFSLIPFSKEIKIGKETNVRKDFSISLENITSKN